MDFVNTRNKYWKQQMPAQVVKKLDKMAENDGKKKTDNGEATLFAYIMKEMKRINRGKCQTSLYGSKTYK